MEDTNKTDGQTVGEEIVAEITDAKNDKNRKVMTYHLKWLLARVEELTSQKNGTDTALKNATEGLEKVKAMSLDEFGVYIKENTFDGPPPEFGGIVTRTSSQAPYNMFEPRTIENTKMLLKKKLNMTFKAVM